LAGWDTTALTFTARTRDLISSFDATRTAKHPTREKHGRTATGVIVIGVGAVMIVEGVTKKFEKQLKMNELHGAARTAVVRLGVIGTIARGVVFAIAGVLVLVLDAAITFNPSKSTGLDGAFRTLANRAYGPWLLGVLALGLIAFGIYGLAASWWAKT
jgi:Domain of Unknown Function (DUF1206)